ncbi:MAG: lytic transglycosylase domain-containing protein [Rhizobiales bacterium]|nr:lytic transglycosylase domain-containing protein [Hyphomicrobiales bacterium]
MALDISLIADAFGLSRNAGSSDLIDFARQDAEAIGIDPDITERRIRLESGGRANAVSPKGAFGPSQLMPATARELADRYGMDPTDPQDNVRLGNRYYKELLDEFGTDELAAAAYQAGPGAVRRAGGIPDRNDGNLTTAQYSARVTGGGGSRGLIGARAQSADIIDAMASSLNQDLKPFALLKDTSQEGFGPALHRGWEQFKTGTQAGLNALGMVENETLAQSIASDAKMMQEAKRPDYLKPIEDQVQKIDAMGDGDGKAWEIAKLVGLAVTNPKATAYLMTENAANQLASLGGMAAGAVGGGMAGSTAGPIGTAVGTLVGLAGGSIVGNSPEFGGKVVELVGQRAQQLGQDGSDPQVVLSILQDPAFRDESQRQGLVKWGTISATDAAFAAVGGKLATAPARSIAGHVVRKGGAVALDAIGEGVGEYSGEGLASGQWKPGSAALEGILALGQSAGEVAISARAWRKLGAAQSVDEAIAAASDIVAAPTGLMGAEPADRNPRRITMMPGRRSELPEPCSVPADDIPGDTTGGTPLPTLTPPSTFEGLMNFDPQAQTRPIGDDFRQSSNTWARRDMGTGQDAELDRPKQKRHAEQRYRSRATGG